jgi:hypothetical protein
LQLKNEVDADIATQTMESVQLMMVQYDQTIQSIKNPRDTTFDSFLGILEDTNGPIEIKELYLMACKRNLRVQAYLGTKWSIASNWKLCEVVRLLLNHPRVKQISVKPLTVQWLSDVYDVCEGDKNNEMSDLIVDENNLASHTSHTSHTKTATR